MSVSDLSASNPEEVRLLPKEPQKEVSSEELVLASASQYAEQPPFLQPQRNVPSQVAYAPAQQSYAV